MTEGDLGMRVSSVAAPVRQQVATSFRTAILTGRFRPGERLVEKQLCELTGASRTSVREALRQLETEGLVEMVPHKGPVVATIDPHQARSIYEVRRALESLAGELCARNASDEQVAALGEAVDGLAAAYATGRIDSILAAKDVFYDRLLAGSGNEIVPSVLRMMHARISLLRRLSLGRPTRMDESIAEIRATRRAVEARDPAAAAAACARHVERAEQAALGPRAEAGPAATDASAQEEEP